MINAFAVEKRVETLASPIDILKGVDLRVNAGEAIAIVGASGSGKTTLLSLLAGLDTPTRGEVIVDGKSLGKLSEDQRAECRLGKIGFVFQNFDLLASLNALENVMLPLELNGEKNAKALAMEILTKVGLEQRYKHFPRQLSGGEQQRVAIARAYVIKPKILFADEPTGCLDIATGEKIIELLFDLKKQMQSSLIFVTHDYGLANKCDKTFLLEDGKLQLMQDK
ncbi:MAG: ABC transporter ATP-binding protein [Gammaproteobacteria bacterium]|jgi:putative ABC transport system ATP-binding protein|nr:ABC transporter ATP-binding protein [Gammaproteobacteria bacterium]